MEEILQRQASARLTPSAPGGSSASGASEDLVGDAIHKSGSSSGASGTAAGMLNLLFSGRGVAVFLTNS